MAPASEFRLRCHAWQLGPPELSGKWEVSAASAAPRAPPEYVAPRRGLGSPHRRHSSGERREGSTRYPGPIGLRRPYSGIVRRSFFWTPRDGRVPVNRAELVMISRFK